MAVCKECSTELILEDNWTEARKKQAKYLCKGRACVAIFTRVVSGSYQSMLRVVYGTKPRKMPFFVLGMNFAVLRPGGRTQTRHPNVLRLVKFSRRPVASSVGDKSIWWRCRSGIALCMRREW